MKEISEIKRCLSYFIMFTKSCYLVRELLYQLENKTEYTSIERVKDEIFRLNEELKMFSSACGLKNEYETIYIYKIKQILSALFATKFMEAIDILSYMEESIESKILAYSPPRIPVIQETVKTEMSKSEIDLDDKLLELEDKVLEKLLNILEMVSDKKLNTNEAIKKIKDIEIEADKDIKSIEAEYKKSVSKDFLEKVTKETKKYINDEVDGIIERIEDIINEEMENL
ncbi:MAG: hypothetical protein AB1478_01740 [Nitrospirota bacterium]